jgi:hypothetical protein
MNLRFILLFIVTPFLIQSCCTEKLCLNTFDKKEIILIGFDNDELNKISFSSFIKNGQFDTQIDSVALSADTVYSSIKVPINYTPNADYLIYFHCINKYYMITDIKMDSEKCNTCFLSEDNYLVLSSYMVNNTEKRLPVIEIQKND